MGIASRLLTYVQLKKIYRNGEKPTPYVVKHSKDKQLLVFIAFNHLNDPADKRFIKIRQEWQAFLDATGGQERIVLTEGGVRPALADEETAIKRFGEPGLLSLLAHQEGILVATPEPPDDYDKREAAKKFPIEAVVYYLFARQIPQWHRTEPKPNFREYMQDMLNRYQQALGWDFDFSFDNLVKVHEHLFNKPFDMDDKQFFHVQSDPTREETVVQQVSRACSRARDEHIAAELVRYWKEGKSIFSVYGSAHVYMIEPVITALQ